MDYWLLVNSKKHITGKGNATKYDVIEAVKRKDLNRLIITKPIAWHCLIMF
ncbi:hypothetical protein A1I_05695 [Rickettsia bellii OSU 85-389]|nr:hypothetical protein [Rickettsia bellii]ABV79465.1 hypothetical protein A1I_05695 [Rickettsia bellii OSU 85-389]